MHTMSSRDVQFQFRIYFPEFLHSLSCWHRQRQLRCFLGILLRPLCGRLLQSHHRGRSMFRMSCRSFFSLSRIINLLRLSPFCILHSTGLVRMSL